MKPTRQRKTKEPCSRCGLNPSLCICNFIPTLTLATRVTLVIHAKELMRTTNTGRLALEALPNSEMKIRGDDREKMDLTSTLSPEYESVLFYPASNAVELDAVFVARLRKPVHLIVPDGNWRQAGKVHVRHTELAHLPRVVITKPNLATHHLRAESTSYGMSTLEAIARALGVIEGTDIGRELLALYDAKLRATLKGRGQIVTPASL